MQPSSLSSVLPFAEEFYGKNIRADRDYLVEKVNSVRAAWWKVEELRQVIFKKVECSCIMVHRDDCNLTCGAPYRAITLPVGTVGLQHVTWNGRRVPVNTSQDNSEGRNNSVCAGGSYFYSGYPGKVLNGPCRGVELMSERFCLERDIPPGYQAAIIFKSLDARDDGKKCGVRYITPTGRIIREDVALSIEGKETSNPVRKFLEITLPARCGYVSVLTFENYDLGDYHPSITAPMHMRVRVDGLPKCGQGGLIHWEGLSEPLPVVFDTDRVEAANGIEWRNSFMWLSLHFKTGKSAAEVQALQEALQFGKASAEAELKAEQSTPVGRIVPRGVRRMLGGLRWLQRW